MNPRLELATGRTATLVPRPATPHDGPRLVAMFERCSPATRYARFLAPLRHFPASHLVDVVRSSPMRRSWVIEDLGTGNVVGVGSWFRNQGDTAELGLLIEDAFQRQGLGALLLDQLAASARDEGITTLVANTLSDARHVHRMMRSLGPSTIECAGTSCALYVSLVEAAEALAG